MHRRAGRRDVEEKRRKDRRGPYRRRLTLLCRQSSSWSAVASAAWVRVIMVVTRAMGLIGGLQ